MKVRMIVSRDGTMILAEDCVVLEAQPEDIVLMEDYMADSDRYNFALQFGATDV